jgi:hypothetical protein
MDHLGLLKGIEIIGAFKAALHLTGCFLAFAMAISPKSNPVLRNLVMSSRDLRGAPKNIMNDTFQ